MNDINLFESFHSRTTNQHGSSGSIIWLIILFALILISWPAYNYVQNRNIQREIAVLETEILGNTNRSLLDEAKDMERYLSVRKKQLSRVIEADGAITGNDWIKEPFLFQCLSTLPRDVSLDNLSVSANGEIEFSGTASNKPAIAELERNLRETRLFEQLYVSAIRRNEDVYSFTMTFNYKGWE